MDKTGTTDAAGLVSFDFKFSAVLDVDVVYYRTSQTTVQDTFRSIPAPAPWDSIRPRVVVVKDNLRGNKIVKIESVS